MEKTKNDEYVTLECLNDSISRLGQSIVAEMSKFVPRNNTGNSQNDEASPTTTDVASSENVQLAESQISPDLQWMKLKSPSGNYMCRPGNVYTMWNAWFDGSSAQHLPPLCKARTRDFSERKDRANYSKLKKVINSMCIYTGKNEKVIQAMPLATRDELFRHCLASLCNALEITDQYQLQKAPEKSYLTIYEWLPKSK